MDCSFGATEPPIGRALRITAFCHNRKAHPGVWYKKTPRLRNLIFWRRPAAWRPALASFSASQYEVAGSLVITEQFSPFSLFARRCVMCGKGSGLGSARFLTTPPFACASCARGPDSSLAVETLLPGCSRHFTGHRFSREVNHADRLLLGHSGTS